MSEADWIISPGCDMASTLKAIGVSLQMLLPDGPVRIEMRHAGQRSLSANALYWQWLDTMARHFSKGVAKFTKDDMHDLMRHKFLGYESRTIGKTELPPQLKSTADLTKAQMHEYMSQLDAWAADHKCLLPRPEDNEYAIYAKEAA